MRCSTIATRKYAYEYTPECISDFEAEAGQMEANGEKPPDPVADYMLIIADHADYPIERGNNDRVYVWLGDEAAAEHLIASSRLGRFFGCTFQVRQIALDLGPSTHFS